LSSLVAFLTANPRAAWGFGLLGVFLAMALFGPSLVPHDPTAYLGAPNQPPSVEFWFGTTGEGKDVFSQTVAGARLTLWVGFTTGLLVIAIGAVLGATAGYFGGLVDDVLSLLTNVFLIIPGLPLAVVIAGYLPQGPKTILLVLVVTGWAWNARVLRAQTLTLREKDFVAAAIVAGESHARVILREILPNMTSLLASRFIDATIYAIGAQVGLEFLGLGDVAQVSWGTNLYWASNNGAVLTGAWWTLVPTGVCVALVGFAMAQINSAIDEVANPRLRAERRWRGLFRKRSLDSNSSTPVLLRD
jgi:peptide/nickel transport system permease protein